jgi:PAS domain S-box-containing protein
MLWRTTLSNVTDTVFVTDEHGNITFVCPNINFIFGYSDDEVMEFETVDRFIGTDFIDFESLEKNGQVHNIHHVVRDKEGRERDVLVGVKKVDIFEGKLLFTVHEVTEIMRYQRELLSAKQKAEIANSAKSNFLANMSHELRTPINGVMGFLQLLKESRLDLEQQEHVQIAYDSCRRFTRLLGDILDLTRMEAKGLEVHPTTFNMRETIRSVMVLLEAAAKEKQLDLDTSVDPGVPDKMTGDQLRLQQILVNLVGNAIKFTTSGRVNLQVSNIESARRDRLRLLFSVQDTGIGISAEQLARIFEPFTQANEGYTRKYQGAGLGLCICKHLVRLMGGSMSIDSEAGAGASVHVSLPFTLPAPPMSQDKHVKTPAALQGKPMHALVVEDDRVCALVAQRLLKKLNYSVTTVENGQRALEALKKDQYDIVFMDIQMEEMDGVEATRRIRSGESGERNRNVPIIALTSYAMSGDREAFLQSGMDGYVAKPVEKNILMKEMSRVLADYAGDSKQC